jgi:ATP-dependent protease ClpP protease subunit
MTQFRLAFNGSIYEKQANALRRRIAEILARQDFEDLMILFSSQGGSTDQGLALYNFIRELPVPIHMHAVGHVGSMAIPVFVAGDRRTATPVSRFFFHAYQWGFEGRQTCDGIAEATLQLDSDITLCRQIVARHCSFPAKILAGLYNRRPTPVVVTPDQALEVGLIHEIAELNEHRSTQQNVSLWTVAW